MWLHVPNMKDCRLPDSVQESECLKPRSKQPSYCGECPLKVVITVSGKPLQRPYCVALSMRPAVIALSTEICSPQIAQDCAEKWMQSLPVSPALLSLVPANRKATEIQGHGEKISTLLTKVHGALNPTTFDWQNRYSPVLLSSRTSPSTSQADTTLPWGRSYTQWVTSIKTRSLAQRQVWEAVTKENAASSWQSIASTIFGQGSEKLESKNWPTACAMEPEKDPETVKKVRALSRKERGGGKGLNLATETKRWPTSAARDVKGMNGEAHTESRERPHLDQLPNAVKNWATATAKHGGMDPVAERTRPGGGDADLQKQAYVFPSTPPESKHTWLGVLLQEWTRPECPRLNAVFQWWLLSLPSPMLICSESAGTALMLWKRQLVSAASLIAGLKVVKKENTQMEFKL